ncbi:hypothetical protein PsorP6_001728 [Peronosclerospora sorghi]|uniref:Uncharacterized protein n=1 Tax=Peronosclerospora sorghi TaxID=230839 RepID=A0ACC0WVW4_9STRA|nr:hypothetical protein PsorP6_001728 [Peronosclerospora sorghi]
MPMWSTSYFRKPTMMRKVAAASLAASRRGPVIISTRATINAHGSHAYDVRFLTSSSSKTEASQALEKAKQFLDGSDMQQAMKYFGVAARANNAEAQYLLGSLLLHDDEEADEDDARQRKTNELIRDAQENRERAVRPEDAQTIREIRKSARAAYKQYLLEQKRKKEVKAMRSASVVHHATTRELDRAFGKTIEFLLHPKSKLEPLREESDEDPEVDAPTQLDTTQAVEWIRRAADNNYRDAHVELGNLCLSHDPPMALEASAWYLNVTEDDNPHPDALYNLGIMLFNGVPHAEPMFIGNKSASIPFFTRAAEMGDLSAQFFMGTLLHQGDEDMEIEPNITSGIKLIEMAANKGHPGALYYLAQLYRSGDDDHKVEADRAKFLDYLDKAMEAGEADAYFCMADIYFHGSDGFDQDYEQARLFYMAAAEQGHADAYCCLGTLYYHGSGVEQDYTKAFLYYQEAAERDSMEAWKNLAEMYTVGRGVPRNEATATAIIKMLRKAEEAEEDAQGRH